MFFSFLYSLTGIAILTTFCFIGAFIASPMSYWLMTLKAKNIMENSGVSKKSTRKHAAFLTVLTVIACVLLLWLIIHAGKQGIS